jgi:transcription initiation factor TFIID subunit 5
MIVISGSPLKKQSLNDNILGITGHTVDQLESFNSQKAQTGTNSGGIRPETMALMEKRLLQKEDKEMLEELTRLKTDIAASVPDSERVPLPTLYVDRSHDFIVLSNTCRKTSEVDVKIQQLKDLSKQLSLGPAALPSVCFYTFHNTQST